MLVKKKELNKIIYENLLRCILFEHDDVTKTLEIDLDDDKTKLSKKPSAFVPHERAKATAQSISPERKAYIIANADSIDPNVYVDKEGNVHSEVTDAERIFLVLHKADLIQSNIEAAMKARKKEEERLLQQRIEKIKAEYQNDPDAESTQAL